MDLLLQWRPLLLATTRIYSPGRLARNMLIRAATGQRFSPSLTRGKNEFMKQEKKPSGSAKTARQASGAKPATAAGSALALRLVPAAPALEPCEAALAAVIGLLGDPSPADQKDRAAEPALDANGAESAPARAWSVQGAAEQLAQALRDFEPQMALKIRALLLSGRDAPGIPAIGFHGTLEHGESALGALARDLSETGPLTIEYLRRGHALACAAGVPLEQPVSTWAAAISRNLDERAWLSFGRQLAKSQPEDWQCLALLDAKAQQISKLYLKLGDNAWWSFQAQIDRPSAATVRQEGRAVERRRSKGAASESLHSVAPRLRTTEGRALRRAARAIRARVGEMTDARRS